MRVTNIELFFDLVYVFAVTQLSHFLLRELTGRGALQAALILGGPALFLAGHAAFKFVVWRVVPWTWSPRSRPRTAARA
jgi:low temperature requirement protein LtrA